ncbi:hypothetical protein THOG05_70123 [Vibrio rotiferianus]|nr:hypothetical protein THOG05_70123 [Vibrio rotiferianus]CAH1559775.1 hypothetical protein THOE12_20165 [Vibrio rotiferianus]
MFTGVDVNYPHTGLEIQYLTYGLFELI